MGPDIVIMAVTHDVSDLNKKMIDPTNLSVEKKVVIGDNVWIGRAIIQPGVVIGSHSIIGSELLLQNQYLNIALLLAYLRVIKKRK